MYLWLYQDCESFAGAVNWLDCTEGPDSCYAYVEDDCVYTGERIGEEGLVLMGLDWKLEVRISADPKYVPLS